MENSSSKTSESSENQEESEKSVSEEILEESREDFLFEIEKNLRNGHESVVTVKVTITTP